MSGAQSYVHRVGEVAKKECIDIFSKWTTLNEGNHELALLRQEKDQTLARELYEYLREDFEKNPPCKTQTIFYTGGYVIKDTSGMHIEERLGADGHLTNQFDLVKDPLGFGIDVGMYFTPWNNSIRIGPFVSFGILHLPVYQTFPNGSFLGTTTNWMAMLGAKAGTMVTTDLFLYGLVGLSLINEDVKIMLGGPLTSQNNTVPGISLGFGAEYQPANWQLFGHPLAVFGEYSHTWSQTVTVNAPAASPLSNYSFRREDDTFKLGFHVYLSAPTSTPPTRGLITK